jgi:hypothetical protein
MSLREFDLVSNQKRLQILLRRLLALESDDLPKAAALGAKLLRCTEVRCSLFELLQDHLAERGLRQLHRGRVRTCWPGRRCLR